MHISHMLYTDGDEFLGWYDTLVAQETIFVVFPYFFNVVKVGDTLLWQRNKRAGKFKVEKLEVNTQRDRLEVTVSDAGGLPYPLVGVKKRFSWVHRVASTLGLASHLRAARIMAVLLPLAGALLTIWGIIALLNL
jgi:hypothetical protein